MRFYLSGEGGLIHALYEALCNNCVQIVVRDDTPKSKKDPVYLSPGSLKPAGFGEHEGMLPYPRRSFAGYGLLQEYFCFPEKFFFLDLEGLDAVVAADFGPSAEVIFLISPFERSDRLPDASNWASRLKTFRLGCAAHRQPVPADRLSRSCSTQPQATNTRSRPIRTRRAALEDV